MEYKDLQIGQKIKIRENSEESQKAKAHYNITEYTVIAKYPRMCLVECCRGKRRNRRGLPLGDLVVNGIIKQRPDIEALKEAVKYRESFRKGGA